MKLVKFLLFATFIFMMTACSSSEGYNPSLCEQLKSKIDKHEQLSEQELNEMIDQTVIMVKKLDADIKACNDDQEKINELKKSPEYEQMATYAIHFSMYLSFNEKDLPEATIEKLKKAEEELKDIKINL